MPLLDRISDRIFNADKTLTRQITSAQHKRGDWFEGGNEFSIAGETLEADAVPSSDRFWWLAADLLTQRTSHRIRGVNPG